MKKFMKMCVLGAIVVASSSTAFGQGYATFGGRMNTFSEGGGSDAPFDATFLWAPSTVTSAAIEAIEPSSQVDGVYYSFSAAWADIQASLTGAGGSWTAATTGGVNVIAAGNSNGSFLWNGLAASPIDNAGAPGTTDSLFVIAWPTEGGLYNTLSAAEAASVPVGWSAIFDYTLGSAPPAVPAAVTVVPDFGIPSPEPTALPLIGSGGLSMLFLRRRKASSRRRL